MPAFVGNTLDQSVIHASAMTCACDKVKLMWYVPPTSSYHVSSAEWWTVKLPVIIRRHRLLQSTLPFHGLSVTFMHCAQTAQDIDTIFCCTQQLHVEDVLVVSSSSLNWKLLWSCWHLLSLEFAQCDRTGRNVMLGQ